MIAACMSATQREAALALLQSGTSAAGYKAATTIMSLEAILRDLESSGPVRNPGWYFVRTCTWELRCRLGHVREDAVMLTALGAVVALVLDRISRSSARTATAQRVTGDD